MSALPNILVIMVDQMVAAFCSAYDYPAVKTPNLDKLVEKGIRFDAAYTPCPLCAPARAGFMTGRHASSINCLDNADQLAADEPTFAHYLTNAGYETVLSGKMHFLGPDQLHGYEKRLTTDVYPAGYRWASYLLDDQGKRKMREVTWDPDAPRQKWGKVAATSMNHRYDEAVHFRALEYLRDQALAPDRPFALTVSYIFPHSPHHAPQAFWDLYKDTPIDLPQLPEGWEKTHTHMDKWLSVHNHVDPYSIRDKDTMTKYRRAYFALVSYVDQKVGELLEALEEHGFADNTNVVFTADHGDMLGERAMKEKRYLYEYSSRIPLIVTYPDGRLAGQKIDEAVSLIDLAPTFMDWAGVAEEDRCPMDGVSLEKVLAGKSGREFVYVESHGEGVEAPCFMVRHGTFKYTYIHGYETQLYDVSVDPEEWNNLSGNGEYKDVEERCKAAILETFDPDAIEEGVRSRMRKKKVLKEAMEISGTIWDFESAQGDARRYVR